MHVFFLGMSFEWYGDQLIKMKSINRDAIEKVEKAIGSLRAAANDIRDASDWKWYNVLTEKQSELIFLVKEMEKDLMEE